MVLTVALILPGSLLAAHGGSPLPLMPWPQQVVLPVNGGQFTLSPELSISVSGDDLADAVIRWRERIARQTGWELRPQTGSQGRPTICIRIARRVNPLPALGIDERYRLQVDHQGVILEAQTRFGALRGMETLLQLVQNGPHDSFIPLVTINDKPRFPWRGLLLDSARHFLPVEDIKRQLDGMAAARLNVLHWHLTDDQGWRLASSHFPALTEKGSDGLFYSQQQMRDIVAYARDLGIRVVPEVDLPGHASALAAAMPELIAAPGHYQIARSWGMMKPVLDPSNERVYQFIDTLVGELTDIFPDSYLHMGGDEIDASQWNESATIQQFMHRHGLADTHALQAYFNRRVAKILIAHKRRMVGWDEMRNSGLPAESVIQSWQGQDALAAAVSANYRAIFSGGFSLNQPQPAAYYYRNDPEVPALNGRDSAQEGECSQSWRFTLLMLKGKVVSGTFTLIDGKKGPRGFIDFDGYSRREVRRIHWLAPDQLTFSVDNWMSVIQPVMTFNQQRISGYARIGNVRYPLTGHRLENRPPGRLPLAATPLQQGYILGGEATLWSELVNARNIDTKLWPRLFVIAERLWSAKAVSDETHLYQRLKAVDRWSVVSVGLQQHAQTELQMMRLANHQAILPLQVFAEVLEPAQYYTRYHLKFHRGRDNQSEALNRLVDVLPAESNAMRELQMMVNQLIKNRGDKWVAEAIRQKLLRWQNIVPVVMPLLEQNYQLQALKPLAQQTKEVSAIGIAILNAMENDRTFGARERQHMHDRLDNAAQVQGETVNALVYPVETLLQAEK
ncbi:beta-N-acetylhexosaminidase [Erwinia sp. OLTSP20]|nr:beta-N-acetylhexosaminidase [Erwinia sp. OAMSP11]PIJ73764.1 beta-N-acetylhexosaminidase [Erwinia sp. OLSSP12]PIJ83127.1 beta-N-acetylhexosaminidase [Erwinia sp. OLCASP19]PIJ85726.1 beta-N-acetylhexosaminidase [Erwinia sp. OLMTSP26]PIJ87756.1 beta-N-acetylhexosaminidase [Erwinia sp. OLMDSP33]PIJ94806.1 beta-N-acetylhexosaminidase [Erwinia sp. OLFS4]PIJ95075.1 beta-N-acetylhexosaminidase [Erwinia sp. OLTSP20]